MTDAPSNSPVAAAAVDADEDDDDVVACSEGSRSSPTHRYELRKKRRRVFDAEPSFFLEAAAALRPRRGRRRSNATARPRDDAQESSPAPVVVVVDDEPVSETVAPMEKKEEKENEEEEEDTGCGSVPHALYEEWCRTRLCTYEGVAVTAADLRRLKPGCLFNDVVVEFYLRHLEHAVLDAATRAEYAFFSPFFVQKLSLSPREAAGARRWTRGIDVFAKRFLVVPINECHHWVLALVCLHGGVFADVPGPAVLFFDSLGTCSIGKHGQRLRRWLSDEWAARATPHDDDAPHAASQPLPTDTSPVAPPQPLATPSRSVSSSGAVRVPPRFTSATMPSHVLRALPHQDNNEDCGVFMLHYVECFATRRPARLADLNAGWFDVACIARKRTEIRDLVLAHAGPMRDVALAVWNYDPAATTAKPPENTVVAVDDHEGAPPPTSHD